jgi:hypothetical protein
MVRVFLNHIFGNLGWNPLFIFNLSISLSTPPSQRGGCFGLIVLKFFFFGLVRCKYSGLDCVVRQPAASSKYSNNGVMGCGSSKQAEAPTSKNPTELPVGRVLKEEVEIPHKGA